ncbi:7-deoxyloganetin glucosyltransferase [Ricinus communis]|nr:7-deoxyloganetin glucosyltransferase [Ricinus communis]|eukprot:XP_002525850.2 7-deoxyloganetin glucosyltransferase [Ricinus communis]
MEMTSMANKPHAVCIPYPAQGHINPMLKLAKLLHQRGFYITFINTEHMQRRLLKSRGPDALNGLPDFQFETIPDGLPPSPDLDSTQDILALAQSVTNNCPVPFRNLLAKLESSPNVPPITCIVSDGIMSFTLDAAEEIGVPGVLFWTASACGFLAYAYNKQLVERGLIPLKDESYLTNGYLDTTVDWIPGMKGIRLKDLPTFRTTDPNDFFLNFSIQEVYGALRASGIILNTYDELEHEVLVALSSMFPPIYTIGPLDLVGAKNAEKDQNTSIGSNLWTDDLECLKWLDSKEPNSVVYVNFGSMTNMTRQQLVELAWGLGNSKQTFLWIIRTDIVKGESTILPEEFVDETKERGLRTSWCPQERVLKHPSIGGFLSHMGWNSTIESLSNGVPVICWPFGGEQQINCWFACNKWGIGMEIENEVKRDEVEKLVRELIEGEKGKEMRKKAMEWKRKAEEATDPNGKSSMNLDRLVNEVLLSQHK